MTTKYFYIILAVLILMISCKKQEVLTSAPKKIPDNTNDTIASRSHGNPLPPPTKKPGQGSGNDTTAAKSVDVYITGARSSTDFYPLDYKACYWKNGVEIPLTNGLSSIAGPIAIQDTDVYILGSITTNGVTQSVYWKNGMPITLNNIAPSGIATSATDVYMSGNVTTTANITIPVVWKNGVITPLNNPWPPGQANAIAVSGNDVYVAGITTNTSGGAQTTVWKNGVPVILSGGLAPFVVSMTVHGSDVYVVGSGGSYWKNGVSMTVQNSNQLGGGAVAIAVYNNDVYISISGYISCGCTDGYNAFYTKNGSLTDMGGFAAGPIAVNGSYVYVIGNDPEQTVGHFYTNDPSKTPNSFQPALFNGLALMRH